MEFLNKKNKTTSVATNYTYNQPYYHIKNVNMKNEGMRFKKRENLTATEVVP
jgi:hypothetical protein